MSFEEQYVTIAANMFSAAGILLYFKHRLDKQDKCLVRIEERLDSRIDKLESRLNKKKGGV